jgi:hypothetical protein
MAFLYQTVKIPRLNNYKVNFLVLLESWNTIKQLELTLQGKSFHSEQLHEVFKKRNIWISQTLLLL